MGCKLCCQDSLYGTNLEIPNGNNYYDIENHSSYDVTLQLKKKVHGSSYMEQKEETPQTKLSLQSQSQILFCDSFTMRSSEFLSFSQRRYLGFRKHFEFDSKRLLIANGETIKVFQIVSGFHSKSDSSPKHSQTPSYHTSNPSHSQSNILSKT